MIQALLILQLTPGLTYAELGPNSQEVKIQRPPSGDNVGVQYSSVLHGEAATKAAVHSAGNASSLYEDFFTKCCSVICLLCGEIH